jgi:hypothetical protein
MYYLVGENDISTAIALKLNYSAYPNTCVPDNKRTCSHAFLSWMKFVARRSCNPKHHGNALPSDIWRDAASP